MELVCPFTAGKDQHNFPFIKQKTLFSGLNETYVDQMTMEAQVMNVTRYEWEHFSKLQIIDHTKSI